MKNLITVSVSILSIIFAVMAPAYAQTRIAVLPFKNMDGQLEYNIWCYNLQDSLAKHLRTHDPEEKKFRIVPIDSVDMALAELNLDPDNPQYFTDLWAAIKKMNVNKVVFGEFNIATGTININASVYDVKIKMPIQKYQAKDVFRKVPDSFNAVDEIGDAILPGL
jgi:TolB-like protein